MMAPVINCRWPGFPRHLSEEAYRKQQPGDQWALRVAYYAPWLLHWWMKQSWLPSSTVFKGTTHLPNRLDAQVREYAMKNSGMFEEYDAARTEECKRHCACRGGNLPLSKACLIRFTET
nr:PREDICTED: uncharacterized protein LOC103971128 [Musa acuminata subsp. malaccensis]